METLDLSFDFKFLDSTFSVCMRCTWTSAAVSKLQSKFHAFHAWLLVWDLTLFSGPSKKQVAAVMHFSSRPEAHHIRGGEGQKYAQFRCVEANVASATSCKLKVSFCHYCAQLMWNLEPWYSRLTWKCNVSWYGQLLTLYNNRGERRPSKPSEPKLFFGMHRIYT